MTTAYEAWIERDPARRAAEVDFGTTWTTDRRPGETWRLSWNTGSGELVAVTRGGDDVEVLGRFDSAEDVSQALPDWAQRALRPGGLDDARHDLAERARGLTRAGVVISGVRDGASVLTAPPARCTSRSPTDAAACHIGADVLDVARVRPDITQGRPVHMLVDDLGHAKGLPLNPLATLLYGSGWPILGTAVVLDDNDAPLPRSLSDGLNTDPTPAPTSSTPADRDPSTRRPPMSKPARDPNPAPTWTCREALDVAHPARRSPRAADGSSSSTPTTTWSG